MTILAVILFCLATVALAVYGVHLYVLLWLVHRRGDQRGRIQRQTIEAFVASTPDEDWPIVTTQIPLYNEMNVAERVIEAVAAMDYPPGRHEVQVLDDSTDGTGRVVDRVAERLRSRGLDVQVVRRTDREGFKAGGLAAGLAQARGELVAIFDSDFVPPPDFLRQAVPLLVCDEGIACVQGRWAHLNPRETWLTRAQALGIDGHFGVEQGARCWNGLLMNFNGTAGIWRRKAIEDPAVGGWTGDTITEDLDLSYRAQLAGWRFDYCKEIACPAEIPGDIHAFKTQQRRWATGSMQVARKLLPRVWRSDLSLVQKIEATFHLTHYSVALWMLLLLLTAQPMLSIWLEHPRMSQWFWIAWVWILGSTFAPSVLYTYARYSLGGGWSGLKVMPLLMTLGMGICANNALAMLRGLFVSGGEFVRTPKSGSTSHQRGHTAYAATQSHLWIVELSLGFYALTSSAYYFAADQWASCNFLLIYAIGFFAVGLASRPRRPAARDGQAIRQEPLVDVSPA